MTADPVRAAAAALVAQLDVVHADSRYETIWTVAALHGIAYRGPTYTAELTALRGALATTDDPTLVDLELLIDTLAKVLPKEVLHLVLDHLRAAIGWATVEEVAGEQSVDDLDEQDYTPDAIADLNRHYDAWLAKRGARTWQPIETAPTDKTLVVVALIRDGVVCRVSDAAFNGLGWYTKTGEACHWRTHWMSLPDPPEAATA